VALQMLGYTPYHMKECIVTHGVPHMRMMEEATRARHFGGVKPYDRHDLQKLLGDYDVRVPVS